MIASAFDREQVIAKWPPSILWSLATGVTPVPTTIAGWLTYALMMVLLAGQVFLPVVPQDEGQLLAYPWFMAHGPMLYRDIWNMYPPGTYVILAALMKTGIPGLVAERGVRAAVHTLYPIINRACTGTWRRFSWLAVLPAFTFLFLVANPDIRAYPWTIGLAVFMAGLIITRTRPRLAAGIFLLATTLRLELVAPAIAALVVLGVLDAGQRRRCIQAAGILVIGAALLLGIMMIVSAGSAFSQVVVDAFIRIPPGRSLPFHPFSISPFLLPLEILTFAGPAACALAAFLKHRPYIVASNVSVAALAPHFLQRDEPDYLYAVSDAVIPWLVVSLILLSADKDRPARMPVQRGTRLISTLSLATIAISSSALSLILLILYLMIFSPLTPGTPASAGSFGSRRVANGTNMIVASSPGVARDDRQVLRYLKGHAASGQRIYISPIGLRHAMWNMTSMYFLLKMRPGTPYLEMNPGVETRASVQHKIISGLRLTTWVLLWHGGFWHEPNASQKLGSALLADYIPSHYHAVLSNQTYKLLVQTGVRGRADYQCASLGGFQPARASIREPELPHSVPCR